MNIKRQTTFIGRYISSHQQRSHLSLLFLFSLLCQPSVYLHSSFLDRLLCSSHVFCLNLISFSQIKNTFTKNCFFTFSNIQGRSITSGLLEFHQHKTIYYRSFYWPDRTGLLSSYRFHLWFWVPRCQHLPPWVKSYRLSTFTLVTLRLIPY